MEMRPAGSPGGTNRADQLALLHHIAQLHMDFGEMKEGAVQPHAMIDDQQIALQREGRGRRQSHHTICRRDDGGTCPTRHIHARMW